MSRSDGSPDLQQGQSHDYAVQYRQALELAKAGDPAGRAILCEALDKKAWKHINLYEVIDVLGEIGDEHTVDILIEFLSEFMGHARGNALRALLKIGTEKAVDSVFEELRTFSPWFGMGTAQLVASYNDKYVPRLLVSSHDPDPLLRARSIYSLGLILRTFENTAIVDALTSALLDEDEEVREHAAQGLALSHPETAESALLEALSDSNIEVAQWAAEGLYTFEQHRDKALEVLIESLSHEDSLVRRHAAWALKRLTDKRAVPALIHMLQTDERRGPKCYALDALGALEDERAAQPLFTSLADEDEMVRAAAVKALPQLFGADVLPRFVEQLFDTDSSVQAAVIEVWEKHQYHPHLHSDQS